MEEVFLCSQICMHKCMCRLPILSNSLDLASGFPTCGTRNAMFCWVNSCDGNHERAPWKMWPEQFDYLCPRFSSSCDYALSLLLSPLTFNHGYVFPIQLPFLISSVLEKYSDSKIIKKWGFARQEVLKGPSFPSGFHPPPLHQSPGSGKKMLKSI